jgi:ATP-dependent RNA helicase DeaD
MFSATMSREVRKIADATLNAPKQVQVNSQEMLPENLKQIYYRVHESDKPEVLCKLIDAADEFYGIIFCQTKLLVADLTAYLSGRGYTADCLHGDKDQNARERTMRAFRERNVNVLVCTDVAARGLDVKDVTHVINYSLPRELDSYVHRIGRTARSGKTGFAMSLVTPSHRGLISRIEHLTKSKLVDGKLPTRKEIGMKKVSGVFSKFLAQQDFHRAEELLDPTWRTAFIEMSKEEIAARFLSLNFPEVFGGRSESETETARPERAGLEPKGQILKAGLHREARQEEPRSKRAGKSHPERDRSSPWAHQTKPKASKSGFKVRANSH